MQGVVAAPIIDTTLPVYVDSEGVSKEAVRWLWYPGDALSPRRKRELKDAYALGVQFNGKPFPIYSNGGIEVNTPCLLRTKGVLPRGMFAPMEVGAIWMPAELLPDGSETFKGVFTEGAIWTPMLPGLKAFPGEAIRSVMTVAQNDQGVSQGVVEITALQSKSWQEVEALGAQYHFFPAWPKIPATLRELEDLIRAGVVRASTSTFEQIGEEMLSSCDQFRQWAMERIKWEETLVAVGTTKEGWTYRLSPEAEQLMAQLEITPQSKALLEAAQLQGQLNKSIDNLVKTQADKQDVPVVDILQKLQENQTQLTEALSAVVERLTSPAPTADTPKPPSKTK
jgi:hypothetical protein